MTDQNNSQFASVSHIALMQRPYGPRIHMDENAASAPGAAEPAAILAPAIDASEGVSLDQAYEAYQKRTNPTAESADPATAANESTDEVGTDPLDAAPGEDEGTDPEAEKLPPVERPRSWSKDADDDWNALPRSRQEKIAANEQAREADIRQRINEAAEKLKGVTAKEQQAEQARQQYEGKLKSAQEVLEREQLRDFSDIKTFDDIERMAKEDPFRKMQWDVHQQRMQLVAHEAQQAESRKAETKRTEQQARRLSEAAKLVEKVPEFADKAKLDAAQKGAVQLFRDIGYSDQELAALGNEPLLDDHRIQVLINDAMKYRAAKAVAPKAVPKPVPNVQRPGAASPSRGSDLIQTSRNKLNSTGSVDDAYALYQAKQKARA